jgi:hypothetical protein
VLHADWQTGFLQHAAYAAGGEEGLEAVLVVAPECSFHDANANPASILWKWGNHVNDDGLAGHAQRFLF